MAGESPDRSKQRESSAEPTSGSAGPVPGKRDPRLAVARDTAATEPRGTADTATRVLSVPDASPAEGEGRTPAEGEGGSPAVGEGGSPEGGEGRLREAVAAWVRSAEPDEDLKGEAGRDTDGGERDTDPAAAAPEAADAAAEDTGTGTSGGGAPGDSGTDTEAGTTPEDAADAGDAPTRTNGAAEDTGPDGTATTGDSASDEAGAGTAADAAPEATRADLTDGDAPEGTGTGAVAGSGSEGTGGAERPEGRASQDTGTDTEDGSASDEARAGTSAEEAPEDARADEAGGSASKDAGTDTEDGSASDEARAGTSAEGAPEDARADEAGGSASKDAGTDTEGGSASGEDGAAPVPGGASEGSADGGAGAVPAARGASAGEGAGEAESESESESDDRGDDAAGAPEDGGGSTGAASEDDATGGKRSVDQPTAVFRTRKPAVDQPTTMLKLGDAGAGTEPEPETEAERTSKFVALKDFDDPAVRKPPPAADATTASRTVPPAEATTSLPQVGPERTTQQPLPPRPPLDLLAELTNTPPPPQTPLRTAVRRVKIWTPLVLLLVIVFAVVQNIRPLPAPTLELTAEDSYTFEGGKPDIPWPAAGQAALDVQGIGTFGSSGEQKPVPIASVAKVMTAYLILRDHPLKSGAEGPMLKIDELAEQQSDAGQESTVNVTAGDEISQREAVESVLIASANNVARLLARWDAGSEKAFVDKMNEAAKDLGMTNTTYTDPSGLNDTTVSTAVDQVKLAKEAMKQPAFREVAAMMSYDDYKGVNHSNWNQLVGHNNVVGIKTGTTTSALGNLVFAAKKEVDGETRTVVGAVVRQPAGGKDNTILSAALTAGDDLIRAAQGALESATILKKGTVVGYADDGLGGRTPVAVTEDVKAVGWAGLSVKLTFAADELPRTAKAGTKVGTLTVGDGTSSAVKVPVALQEDLVEPGFTDRLTRLT
ncbi:D-alanyl-D-alanine carboxypeptidase [Streptomyces griseoflavus]|uniref:D-alanyl-D-alanine carboxypeptidase n=1 Tax=Streptomyces griseoflavus TaxID=35619 RepID=UPI003D713717